jgi:defect-in-organelle-trafficking protein DotD
MSKVAMMMVAAVAALANTGCATRRQPPPAPQPVDEAKQALSESATRVGTAVEALNRMLGGPGVIEERPPSAFPDDQIPAPLDLKVDITWHGDMEPAVEELAKAVGFEFRAVGPRPAQPILVLLDGIARPVGAFLREAGQQAGARANVVVRMAGREVEVVYRDDR